MSTVVEQDDELIRRALERVAHIAEERPAARELGIAPRTLKQWREGERPPMREPTRQKLLTKLAGETKGVALRLPDWLQEACLADARAAEFRARAEMERAVAARLEAENARDRNRWLSPSEQALRIGEQGRAAIEKEKARRDRIEPRSGSPPPPQSQDPPEGETGRDSDDPGSN